MLSLDVVRTHGDGKEVAGSYRVPLRRVPVYGAKRTSIVAEPRLNAALMQPRRVQNGTCCFVFLMKRSFRVIRNHRWFGTRLVVLFLLT